MQRCGKPSTGPVPKLRNSKNKKLPCQSRRPLRQNGLVCPSYARKTLLGRKLNPTPNFLISEQDPYSSALSSNDVRSTNFAARLNRLQSEGAGIDRGAGIRVPTC